MMISLSEIMQVVGGTFSEKVFYEAETLHIGGSDCSVLERGPLTLTVDNTGGRKVLIGLLGTIVLSVPCDRCLRAATVTVPLSTEREIDFSKSQEERAEDLDETYFINGYDLDVDEFVYEEILPRFPMKVLCQNDCKGICKVCGANLNDGECGCDRTEPDPRMSVIKDLFNNFKEV